MGKILPRKTLIQTWNSFGMSQVANVMGSMYGIYGNIYHQNPPNVSIYTIHGSYGNVMGFRDAFWDVLGSLNNNCRRG